MISRGNLFSQLVLFLFLNLLAIQNSNFRLRAGRLVKNSDPLPSKMQSQVRDVLDAVNISFQVASTAINRLIVSNLTLTNEEGNAILAAFLIERDEDTCRRRYRKGHEFFQRFGTPLPRLAVNQLHCNGLSKLFHQFCIAQRNLFLNPVLYRLFGEFIQERPSISDQTNTVWANTVWVDAQCSIGYILEEQADYQQELKNQIQNGSLVVMTGIGVSLGLVNDVKLTWSGLLDEIRLMVQRRRPDILPDDDWVGTPEEKARKLDLAVNRDFPHLDYRQYVSSIMRTVASPIDQHPLAIAINNLNLPIATTNYDLLLDQSLQRFEQNLSNVQIRFSSVHHTDFIYHIHGVWFDSNSVVLSSEEYEKTKYDFQYTLGKLFFDSFEPRSDTKHQSRSLLFIGCKNGLIDLHFKDLYADPRYVHLCHYALLKRPDLIDLMKSPEFRQALCTDRLRPIIYGESNDNLQGFLEQLVSKKRQRLAELEESR
jgi:hypothetical protein